MTHWKDEYVVKTKAFDLFEHFVRSLLVVLRTGFTSTSCQSRRTFVRTSPTRWRPSGTRGSRSGVNRAICGQCGLSITCTSSSCTRSTAIWTSMRTAKRTVCV